MIVSGGKLTELSPLRDVVERLVVQGATADLVDGRVDEAEVVPCVLVGERYEPCPQGGAGARTAVALYRVARAARAHDNGHAGMGRGNRGHVGHAAVGPDARDALLVARAGDYPAETASRRLELAPRVPEG